jgi:hypothetical protein
LANGEKHDLTFQICCDSPSDGNLQDLNFIKGVRCQKSSSGNTQSTNLFDILPDLKAKRAGFKAVGTQSELIISADRVREWSKQITLMKQQIHSSYKILKESLIKIETLSYTSGISKNLMMDLLDLA